MKYNAAYVDKTWNEFKEAVKSPDVEKYEIDIDGFNTPPVIEMFRYMQESDSQEVQDRIAKLCILGKRVSVTLGGKEIGGFQVNSPNDLWDAHQVLQDHPNVYTLLINLTGAFILKKYMPHLSKNSAATEAAATQK